MRTALALMIWLTLAAIGVASAGFWGFLGVAFLYVLYYGLLHPRVTVHMTAEEMEQQRAVGAARAAITLGKVAAKLRTTSDTSAHTEQPRPPSSLRSQVDDKSDTWVCICGKRNARRRLRCSRCDGWSPD